MSAPDQDAILAESPIQQQGKRLGAGLADLAAEHEFERIPFCDLAEEAMVRDLEARGKPRPERPTLGVNRRLGENRIEVRR